MPVFVSLQRITIQVRAEPSDSATGGARGRAQSCSQRHVLNRKPGCSEMTRNRGHLSVVVKHHLLTKSLPANGTIWAVAWLRTNPNQIAEQKLDMW